MKKIAFITFEFPPEMATGGIGSYFSHICELLSCYPNELHVFSATLDPLKALTIDRGYCKNHLIYANTNEEFRNNVINKFSEVHELIGFDLMESPEVGACAFEIKKKHPNIRLVVKLHTPGVCITKISRKYQPLNQKLRFVLGNLKKGVIDFGYWATKDKKKHKDVEYQICMAADLITCPSKALRKWVSHTWDIELNKIKVVPNPYVINNSILPTNEPKRQKIILFVGKLTVLKGMVEFTKAIPDILNKNPEYQIVFVGRDEFDPYINKSLKEYIQERTERYAEKIVFTGQLDKNEVYNFFRNSEIAVFPSLWENYPTVALEAMALGCVVAASNVGGFPEIISNGVNGLLFNPLNHRHIARTINLLTIDNGIIPEMRASAFESIRRMQSESFISKITSPYF